MSARSQVRVDRGVLRRKDDGGPSSADGGACSAESAAPAIADLTDAMYERLSSLERDLSRITCEEWRASPRARVDVRALAAAQRRRCEPLLPALTSDLDAAFGRLSRLDRRLRAGERRACLAYHRALVQPFFMRTPWGRRVAVKPFGYAGDYLVVESIYDGEQADLGEGLLAELLSRYLLDTGPCRAHRARLPWAHDRLTSLADASRRPLRVLSFACGPERILREYVATGGGGRLVLCDFDPNALAFCRRRFQKLLRAADDRADVAYVQLAAADVFSTPRSLDALRDAVPGRRYDAILVLGLLDYLPAVKATPFLDALASLLAAGGELLLSNVHAENPWRALMEYEGDWYVTHRSHDEFLDLAAGNGRVTGLELVTDATGTNLLFAGARS